MERLIVPSGCNTAAPELHLRPAVTKSPSTLDAFPGSAHPTPLAKVNASPPAKSHHPPYTMTVFVCRQCIILDIYDLFFFY